MTINERLNNCKTKIVQCVPRLTVRTVAESVRKSVSTVHRVIKELGFASKLNVCVPRSLTEANRLNRVDICDNLKIRNKKTPFLKNLITGDEKWIVCNHVTQKRSWGKANEPPQSTSKEGFYPRKVMLSIWWHINGNSLFRASANKSNH